MLIFCLQGIVPLTFSPDFSEAVKKFNKQFLSPAKSYSDLVAVIVFLKEHPLVNEKLLEYAVTATIINRPDLSTDLISPLEVVTTQVRFMGEYSSECPGVGVSKISFFLANSAR